MSRIPVYEIEIGEDENTEQAQAKVVTAPTDHNHKKRGTGRKAMKLPLLTLLFILQIHNASSAYTVKHIQPGFYVEEIGSANIDRGVFRIETNFERNQLEQNYAKIKDVTAKISYLCNRDNIVAQETSCKQFYHHLQEQGSMFENTKAFLTEINRTRKKRGLLGNLLTSIFGVNDEAYRDIEALQKNQDQLIDAANHQTKFMISAVAQLNNTEAKVNKKLQTFQKQLNDVIKYLSSKDNWYSKVDRNGLNIQVMQTYELASNYIKEITDQYDGLQEIYSSKASVYTILTPSNVSDIIASANKKLPSNLKIIQQLLIDTKIAENATHIQVYAYFPIQEVTKYTLLHVTAVPRKNADGSFQSIEVNKSYVAVDYNNELYFDMTQTEFKNCLQKLDHFICYPGVVKKMRLNENCVVDHIFTNDTQTKCLTKSFYITKEVLWKQLYVQNTWLYVVKDPITASIVCDGQREEVVLKDVGLIRISDNCLIKVSDHTLVAHRLVNAQTAASFIKPINFTVHTFNSSRHVFNITKTEVVDNANDILHHIMEGETNLKTELDSHVWTQISNHAFTSSFLSSLMVFVVLSLMICFGPRVVQWMLQHSTCCRQSKDHNRLLYDNNSCTVTIDPKSSNQPKVFENTYDQIETK